MDAFDGVASWRPVSATWQRHRPEPLLHERLWGCDLELDTPAQAADPYHWLAGFDAEGRPVAIRQARTGAGEIVVSEGRGSVVRDAAGSVTARTMFDDAGCPVCTEYPQRGDVETYAYDAEGRIAVIEESPGVVFAVQGYGRWDVGGRSLVEHDAQGPILIRSPYGLVWDRDEPGWPEMLDPSAADVADACLDTIRAADVDDGTAVFSLAVIYVDQGSIAPMLSFGLDAERQGLAGEAYAFSLFYPDGIEQLEPSIDGDLDWRLLRAASMGQTGDPYRAVLTEVTRRLLARPWAPKLVRTDDFVAFIAEHDEGFASKVTSIHEVNPPDQVARWEAALPPGAPLNDG
jgi:hypothetical protein